jgi:hypothetical protein
MDRGPRAGGTIAHFPALVKRIGAGLDGATALILHAFSIAAATARRKGHRDAQREGYRISQRTLVAADWVIIVISLGPRPAGGAKSLVRHAFAMLFCYLT